MKKLLILSTLFLAFACTGETEESQEEALFLEINDGKGFVYSTEYSDKHIFFYDSDIFLKEVMVSYPELNSYCTTMKEGANSGDAYSSPDFNAEIVVHDKDKVAVRTSYTDVDENTTVYTLYQYRQDGNNIIVFVDGISKTYSATSITYASLCN